MPETITENDAQYAYDLVKAICTEVGPGSPGTFGYVSPGDYHTGINTRPDLRGEVIFCYAGVNDKDDADTVWIDPPQIVVDHLAERGLTLEDMDL